MQAREKILVIILIRGCKSSNQCESNGCQNDGKCYDVAFTKDRMCSCKVGYEGDDCQDVINVCRTFFR